MVNMLSRSLRVNTPNLVMIRQTVAQILQLDVFKMAAVCHLELLKF